MATNQLAIAANSGHLSERILSHARVIAVAKRPRSEVNARLREAQLAWLAEVERRTGKTASEIARGAGLDPSTLTGFKTGRRSQTLETLTITEISTRWNVHVTAAVRGAPEPRGFAEEAAPYQATAQDPIGAAVLALIAGRNGITSLTLHSPAIELAGYLPGDVILVDLNGTPAPGDAVMAQVYDWPSMTAKTIVRVFEHAAPVNLLVPKSRDPAFQTVVADGEKVMVKGVILPHRLRPLSAAA